MYYDEKFRFYQSLFGNFYSADDHWEVILDLKSVSPVYLRQPVRRKSCKSNALCEWYRMRQHYIYRESATTLSDRYMNFKLYIIIV